MRTVEPVELTKREREAVNDWLLEDRRRIEALEEVVMGLPDLLEEHARLMEEQVAKLGERVTRVEELLNATTTAERHARK